MLQETLLQIAGEICNGSRKVKTPTINECFNHAGVAMSDLRRDEPANIGPGSVILTIDGSWAVVESIDGGSISTVSFERYPRFQAVRYIYSVGHVDSVFRVGSPTEAPHAEEPHTAASGEANGDPH